MTEEESLEARRLSECVGKEALSPEIAKSIMVKHKKKKGRDSFAYRCSFCSFWHIGTNRDNKKKMRRK